MRIDNSRRKLANSCVGENEGGFVDNDGIRGSKIENVRTRNRISSAIIDN